MRTDIMQLLNAAATIGVCVVGYAAAILGVAQLLSPATANGSLIRDAAGTVVGSRLIAQPFEQPEYFWPRPSAVDHNAAAGGGSNLSPTSADLTERARAQILRHGATAANPLPPELAAASGGGLDPHLSEHAALYQVPRVARARGAPAVAVEAMVRGRAFAPGSLLTSERIVNVLELNLALDAAWPRR
jgi:K+-transporting ATPase ATPase C chain